MAVITSGHGPELRLRPALLHEGPALSALCQRSKALWGYSREELERFRSALEITPDRLRGSLIQVAELAGEVVGMVELVGLTSGASEVWLESLFVDSAWVGQGVGQTLFKWAVERCRMAGVVSLLLDADPHAEAFYVHMGARRIALVPSSCMGERLLPRLRFRLKPTGQE